MQYRKGMLQGRLLSGAQSDHGSRVHAVVDATVESPRMPGVMITRSRGLCGRLPGRRSVGWAWEPDRAVDCPTCLIRLRRAERLESEKSGGR